MDGGGKITMDGGSSNGQRWCNRWQDNKVIAIGDGTAVAWWMAQWAVDDHHQCRSNANGGNARWPAAAITMDGGGKIAMEGGSSDGQRQHNGRRDGKAIAIGNGIAVAWWTEQWAVYDCPRCRSSAIGGNARWTAVAITMDSGGVMVMDSGSSNVQWWRHNGQWYGRAVAMGDEMAALRVPGQWPFSTPLRSCTLEKKKKWYGFW